MFCRRKEFDSCHLNSFTTINADGSNTLYLFGTPIKYIDQSTNKIKFIDNSILPVLSQTEIVPPAEGEADLQQIAEPATVIGYTNAANDFSVNMPASVNDGISLIKGELSVTLYPALPAISSAALSTETIGAMTEQVVEYPNALGNGVHLQYLPINGGIKENIVLDSYTGVNTFNFIVEAQGYYPLYTEGEAIPFAKTGTEKASFILGQVDARDSYTGEETDGHFTLYNSLSLIEIKDGIYGLTVTVDPEFLADPDTVYPVVIDPSVTLYKGSFRDTSVYSGKPFSQTFYSSSYNIVGYHNDSYGVGIAYIQTKKMTDFNYIDPERIITATYKVYEGSGKTNSVSIGLYTTTANWDHQTITYNSRPSLNTLVDSNTVNKSGWYSFDITNHIKNTLDWSREYAGYSQTRGFALVSANSSASSKHFCSAEYTGSTTPSIIINYTANTTQTLGSVKGWGKDIVCNQQYYSFTVPSAANYIILTKNSYDVLATSAQQTEIRLFNNIYERIAYNQQFVPTGSFSNVQTSAVFLSYIEVQLSAGTYYVKVSDFNNHSSNNHCYLIVYKSGELEAFEYFDHYSQNVKEFYKIDNASSSYNCFAYALFGITNTNISVSGLTRNNLLTKMTERGYSYVSYAADNCIVAYYNPLSDNSEITHFARIDNGVVTAKIGAAELVQHPSYEAYFEGIATAYGMAYAFFVKI